MSFNSHTPSVLGLEWRPVHEDRLVMNSTLTPFAARLDSTVTETIDTAWLYSVVSTGRLPESYQLDIYEDGVFPDDLLTTLTAYPSADAASGGCSTWNGTAGTTNRFSFINNVTQVPITLPDAQVGDDDFLYSELGNGYSADFRFDGLAAALAGNHIVKVRLHAQVQPYAAVGETSSMTITPYLYINNILYYGAVQTLSGRVENGHEITEDWFVNPDQLRSWLPDDLDGFDQSVGTASAGWYVRPTGSPALLGAILQGDLQVQHAGLDTRVAIGYAPRSSQLAGLLDRWFPISLIKPDGTANWAKLAATSYRVSWRRQTVVPGGRQLGMIAGAGYDPKIVNGWQRMYVKHRVDTFLPYEAVVDPGALTFDGSIAAYHSWAPGFVMMVGANPSVNSQPYIELDEQDAQVFAGHELRQYFTTPAALPDPDFYVVQALIGQPGVVVDADLVITVHRQSDNVQVGSTLTLTPTAFEAIPGGKRTGFALYKNVALTMAAPATLAVSTQYYFKFLSAATTKIRGWRVEVARSDIYPTSGLVDTLPSNIANATFGGSANSAWYDTVFLPVADVEVSISTIPDPVVNFTASSGGSGCIEYIDLEWDATSLAGEFARYEVQRRDTPESDWALIYTVTSEAVTTVTDFESRRGVPSEYRVRVIRTDTSPSVWASVATATANATCCGYILTSNVNNDLTIWADDVSNSERPTEWPQNVIVKQFYGRNYQVGFHELERRGAQFTRTLLIASAHAVDGTQPSSDPGQGTFDALFAIARPSEGAGLPYVCVHEETGDRWFATLKTPSTVTQLNAGNYTAEVEFLEVTDIPYAPTVEV